MGKFIPVDPDRWAELVKAAGERDALVVEVRRLDAEVERLTAKQTDIDRVQAQSDFYRSKLMNETAYTANVQLLDQVNHLEAEVARLTDFKAKADQSEAENARLKQSLRFQIEQNALAKIGFKMYQHNVDSGGLHKDRKDAIARLEAENARLKAECQARQAENSVLAVECDSLKAEVERLTKAGDALYQSFDQFGQVDATTLKGWLAAKGVKP